MSSITSSQSAHLHFESVDDLKYLAISKPNEAFWRAIDKAISCFDALQMVPAGDQRVKARKYAAKSVKSVLETVRLYSKKRLSKDAESNLDSAIKTLGELKEYVNNDTRFNDELNKLRSIARNYPEDAIQGKNVLINETGGKVAGMKAGDNGDIEFHKGFKPMWA